MLTVVRLFSTIPLVFMNIILSDVKCLNDNICSFSLKSNNINVLISNKKEIDYPKICMSTKKYYGP